MRLHLSRIAGDGVPCDDVVAIGPWWSTDSVVELHAVVLADTSAPPGAKWARSADDRRIERRSHREDRLHPRVRSAVRLAVAARHEVKGAAADTLAITARNIFR